MNEEYLNEYYNYLKLERKYSINTVKAYLNDLSKFSAFIKKDLLMVREEDIRKYLKNIASLSNKTVSHNISSLKSFYNYELRKEKIKINPMLTIDTPKIEKNLPTVLSIEEVDTLLNIDVKNEYDARNKAILELLYSTGVRISELTNLELANIDFDEELIRVMGKGSKERIIPMGEYASNVLKDYLNNYRNQLNIKNSTYVFLNNIGTKLSRQFIFKIIKLECLKKGIKKNVSPHTLRHTYATHLLKNGADLRIIQELLGHENLATTQIYTHITNDKLKNDYHEFFPRN